MFNRIYLKSDKTSRLITDAYTVVWLVFKTTLILPSYNCSKKISAETYVSMFGPEFSLAIQCLHEILIVLLSKNESKKKVIYFWSDTVLALTLCWPFAIWVQGFVRVDINPSVKLHVLATAWELALSSGCSSFHCHLNYVCGCALINYNVIWAPHSHGTNCTYRCISI